MKCEECGRQLLRDEKTCPYCGRVYGLPISTRFLFTLVLLIVIVFLLVYKGS